MWPRVRTTSEWKGAVLVVACLLLGSCSRKPVNSGPYVVFDKVPNATLGGPDKLETIKGRVLGAGPGQQIVLYAKSEGLWWIQPFTEKPFTKIENGRRWENETHLGTEYAALLVEPGYRPPPTTENLPTATIRFPSSGPRNKPEATGCAQIGFPVLRSSA